jgi:hypothetical protein
MFLPFVQLCKWAGRTLGKQYKIKWIAHKGGILSLSIVHMQQMFL